MLSGRSSPLPSFTPPIYSSANRSFNTIKEPGTLAEKVSLAFKTSTTSGVTRKTWKYREWSLPSYVSNMFIKLKINGSTTGGRTLTIPVLKFLYRSSNSRTSLRKDGRLGYAAYHSTTLLGALPSIFGTIVILIVFSFLLLSFILNGLGVKHRKFSLEANTLVLSREEVEQVWKWEMASGRYPSRRSIDIEENGRRMMGDGGGWYNGGVPKRGLDELKPAMDAALQERRRLWDSAGTRYQLTQPNIRSDTSVLPIGVGRTYLPIPKFNSTLSLLPHRPVVGSAIDLDVVMDYCDFAEGKYVRDCLEVLRSNAGLDSGLRRGDASSWRATFLPTSESKYGPTPERNQLSALLEASESISTLMVSTSFTQLLKIRQQLTLSAPLSPPYQPHPSHPSADPACDPNNPRLFHIFWAGPFTDKPYLAILSFLYTQNLGLHLPTPPKDLCRPQMWIWINPGPASSLPDEEAEGKMVKELEKNPWSSPFLNKRFNEVVKFRLWNTTEQLDAVEEMKGWRDMRLFNSGGTKYGAENSKGSKKSSKVIVVKDEPLPPADDDLLHNLAEGLAGAEATKVTDPDAAPQLGIDKTLLELEESNSTIPDIPKPVDELLERVGSTSSKGYDRLTVVLSDMARFVLTHRYGGVYLDADNILLRDWEEIWNWHGAFAYRWSRLEKYNTAVLKMQRGSALGNFIFRTAVANGLDFHPMTVSRYTKDAGLEGLLLRLPDALFDSAWLNTEYYQRDRPTFPYFKQFEDFFATPKESSAAPIAIGFDGFFRGAFCYHFHNGWWIALDPIRNFPDLGTRFVAGERLARGRLLAAKLAAPLPTTSSKATSFFRSAKPKPSVDPIKIIRPFESLSPGEKLGLSWGQDERDFEELDWSDEKIELDYEGEGGQEVDRKDLSWSTVLKRTFESYVRGERGNMYGEVLVWNEWNQVVSS